MSDRVCETSTTILFWILIIEYLSTVCWTFTFTNIWFGAWIMYSRKELSGLSRVSGQPTYRNVQQLAQEYRRMTSSRDNVSSSRGVRDPHASVESGTQFVRDKGPPKHAEPKEIRDATSPSKTYRQRHQGDDLYENARFYRKQAIYNWINSSEQVTQSQCCTA